MVSQNGLKPTTFHYYTCSNLHAVDPLLLRNWILPFLGYPFRNDQIIYLTYASLSFTERAFVLLFQKFSSFVKQRILILLNIMW